MSSVVTSSVVISSAVISAEDASSVGSSAVSSVTSSTRFALVVSSFSAKASSASVAIVASSVGTSSFFANATASVTFPVFSILADNSASLIDFCKSVYSILEYSTLVSSIAVDSSWDTAIIFASEWSFDSSDANAITDATPREVDTTAIPALFRYFLRFSENIWLELENFFIIFSP